MGSRAKKPSLPKRECCLDRPRCKRCPIRALAEGTMPPGYTVKRRRLVRIDGGDLDGAGAGERAGSGKKSKAGKGRKRRDGVAPAA